jgi:prepilin-type N-terminal cleavage/methylation domain-containing protein
MRQRQSGFTIIELLIATTVFSIVLLTIAAAIVQIGRIYIKGVTNTSTQQAARSLASDVADALRFEGNGVPVLKGADGSPQAWCIGQRQYSFQRVQQVDGGKHGVLARTLTSGNCSALDPEDVSGVTAVAGRELLGDKMRVSFFDVKQLSIKLYSIDVRVVYGDDDLLCGGAFSCDSATALTAGQIASIPGAALRCKDLQSGTQFCAVAELRTTVERRLVQ